MKMATNLIPDCSLPPDTSQIYATLARSFEALDAVVFVRCPITPQAVPLGVFIAPLNPIVSRLPAQCGILCSSVTVLEGLSQRPAQEKMRVECIVDKHHFPTFRRRPSITTHHSPLASHPAGPFTLGAPPRPHPPPR